jgi:hypothetical protein
MWRFLQHFLLIYTDPQMIFFLRGTAEVGGCGWAAKQSAAPFYHQDENNEVPGAMAAARDSALH